MKESPDWFPGISLRLCHSFFLLHLTKKTKNRAKPRWKLIQSDQPQHGKSKNKKNKKKRNPERRMRTEEG